LEQWVSSYVHQPVLATPGINYLNQVPINFDRCTELFSQETMANALHRARMIPAIESGAVMRTSMEVLMKCDTHGKPFLTWGNGGIRDYVVGVFQQLGLAEPKEMQINKMFTAFDVNKNNVLGVHECLLLVDAIARTVFRADPPQPSASSGAVPNVTVANAAPAGAAPQPLGTQAAASPFLALLAGLGRQDGLAQDAALRPIVYSTLVNHGQRMPSTEVLIDGSRCLIDGSISLARILCQRAPTSVLSGGAHAEEVRLRLQQKAAAMIAAHQAMVTGAAPAGSVVTYAGC
jgi:hypothetical protein